MIRQSTLKELFLAHNKIQDGEYAGMINVPLQATQC
jgi:hypothetical protein